jgi:hypothetical protein
MKQPKNNNELLNLKQLQERWGVSDETIRARRREGLRIVRIGNLIYFRLSDVLEFEEARIEIDKESVA